MLGGLLLTVGATAAPQKMILKSPDAKLAIEASLNAKGALTYTVKKDGNPVLQPSQMGLQGDVDFTLGLTVKSVSKVQSITETYISPAEKRANRTYTANASTLVLKNKDGKTLTVEFRATNEGVAFRYLTSSAKPIAIKWEQTSYKFPVGTKAWLHPYAKVKDGWCQTQPSYEEQYEYDIPVGTPSTLGVGWTFPALFKSGNTWVMLTEAGLTPDYAGTHLAHLSEKGEYRITFPQKGETVDPNDPEYPVSANITSPWRVIVVGSLATVVESQMVSDLAKPADKNVDYSWVKTGVASWSWGVLHDESVNYDTSKQFIDHAANMHWDYCLIDADWDRKIGYDRIKELADYAKTKNVKLILWYNSSGPWNTTVYSPKGALLTHQQRMAEFGRIHDMGIAGIKVDFWPGDGQSSIQLYYDMMKDAADNHLVVNFHGTTVPRGWSRTFPNLVSMESIRGFEFTTFDQKDTDKAPKHLTMMPYARNVVGPMDFTPVCFGEIRGKQRRTSNGFEIALSVILQSGVSHFVEIPESMAKQPDYVQEFMRNIPRHWDDIKLIDGFPGKYVVMARKSGDKWYLAGINSQADVQKMTLDLSALKGAATKATMITDGDTNRSFIQKPVEISNNKLEVEIKPNGGFVVEL
ncbi:MAG: hypothetical protein RIS29_122 [Bacteroidota bacterium]